MAATIDLDTVDLDQVLREVAEVARPCAKEGELASYITSLATEDPDRFGIAMVGMEGTEHAEGDADVHFPIQSISKVFSLVLAMQKAEEHRGVREELWSRVGREPSGDPFNSLVQLEHERGIPRNPMINAGAFVVDDVLLDHCDDPHASMIALMEELTGEEVRVDERVWGEEAQTSTRNLAIANLIKAFGNLEGPVEDVLDVYNHACSISMTTRQLARATRFLANRGVNPLTGREILPPHLVRRVAAIMLTCGTYDNAGEFAFNVGIPCKSGVAGAIIGVVTDLAGVCVWSPPLDPQGNSVAGEEALHQLSERLELSRF